MNATVGATAHRANLAVCLVPKHIVALALVISFACGGGGGGGGGGQGTTLPASPSPPQCPAQTDATIAVDHDRIEVAASAKPLDQGTCYAFASHEEVAADRGGQATGSFGKSSICTFSQIAPSQAKAADVTRRDSPDLFSLANDAEAVCTINGYTRAYCGQGSVSIDGLPFEGDMTCTNDPHFNVAIRHGSATLYGAGGSLLKHLKAGQIGSLDLVTSVVSTSPVTFDLRQVSLFEAQFAAITGGVSILDYGDLLRSITALDENDEILAPNVIQSRVGGGYGFFTPMCDYVAQFKADVVVYPSTVLSEQPILKGASCLSATGATVYGIVIFKPNHQADLTYSANDFLKDAGEVAIWHQPLYPFTLSAGATQEIFVWPGSTEQTFGTIKAPPGIYIAHVLYRRFQEVTPRVELVAISLGGAHYPSPPPDTMKPTQGSP